VLWRYYYPEQSAIDTVFLDGVATALPDRYLRLQRIVQRLHGRRPDILNGWRSVSTLGKNRGGNEGQQGNEGMKAVHDEGFR